MYSNHNSYQVMIDLETFATSNNAQIVSIGAVKFDRNGINDEFYQNIKLNKDSLFEISGETVLWWLSQSKESQDSLLKDSLNLKDSLVLFSKWFNFGKDKKGQEVWGNGATFDNVILRNAYNKLNLECPWSYRDDRCFRTMARVLEQDLKQRGIFEEFSYTGTKHNALQDAKNQTEYLIHLCRLSNIKL